MLWVSFAYSVWFFTLRSWVGFVGSLGVIPIVSPREILIKFSVMFCTSVLWLMYVRAASCQVVNFKIGVVCSVSVNFVVLCCDLLLR